MVWADYQHMFCVMSSSLKFVSVSSTRSKTSFCSRE